MVCCSPSDWDNYAIAVVTEICLDRCRQPSPQLFLRYNTGTSPETELTSPRTQVVSLCPPKRTHRTLVASCLRGLPNYSSLHGPRNQARSETFNTTTKGHRIDTEFSRSDCTDRIHQGDKHLSLLEHLTLFLSQPIMTQMVQSVQVTFQLRYLMLFNSKHFSSFLQRASQQSDLNNISTQNMFLYIRLECSPWNRCCDRLPFQNNIHSAAPAVYTFLLCFLPIMGSNLLWHSKTWCPICREGPFWGECLTTSHNLLLSLATPIEL